MEVRLLGPVELVGASGATIPLAGSKMRGLVAMLALDPGSTVTPQRLIDAVWGEQEVNGPNVVHVTVSKLRRVLADAGEDDRVVTRAAGYELRVDRGEVDALRFETLVDRARTVDNDPDGVTTFLADALALWRGVPLTGAPETEISGAIRSRFEEMQRGAVEDLVEAELALGRHRRLAPELEALVAEEPLRERRWGQLMRAQFRSGRQADALRTYTRARDVLIDRIGVEPGAELRELEAAILAQDESLLAVSEAGASAIPIGEGFRRHGNVRFPVGSCIGRDDDLETLSRLVDAHRLVTLTGPGGVGKTRLALELCVTLHDRIADGVWWVDLATARDRSDALAAMQRAIGVDPVGARDDHAVLASIVAVMENRAAVFVLDNCEHLLGLLAPAVDELLGRCGGVRVVATSREGLGITAEARFEVEPLAASAAVALFMTRASRPVAGDDADAEVLEICERLDRLPLALELAAARTRHLRLTEILERLSDRFELLAEGPRTAATHQRSLRAVADWSYELLDESERVVFERLSVFADGATLDAAKRVCAAPDMSAPDVERLLHRLVDKSLVISDRTGAETRYRMLQTLAEYADERLQARGQGEAARRAHALWVRELAATVQFGAPTRGPTIAAVQAEDIAVRDAISWALVAEPLLALEICTDLGSFWFGTMRVSVGWELLVAALDAEGCEDGTRRSAGLVWAIVFATMVGDVEMAERFAEEALEHERSVGDPDRLGRLCFALALAAGYRSDGDASRWIEEARAHFAAVDLRVGLGHVSFAEGAGALVFGDLDVAWTSLHDAIAVFREHDDHLGLILAVSRLGELAWRRDDVMLFAEMHADLLDLGRAGGSLGVIAGATARLGLARHLQGRTGEAQQLARDALASTGETFMPVVNGYVFKTAGIVNLSAGHVAEGRHQLNAAIEAFEQGTGSVGIGQAATCWVDLSRSYLATGESEAARRAAERAVATADAAGDPWIRDHVQAHLAALAAPGALESR